MLLIIPWYTVVWAYEVVVIMFDCQRSDGGSNPSRGSLRLHYSAI